MVLGLGCWLTYSYLLNTQHSTLRLHEFILNSGSGYGEQKTSLESKRNIYSHTQQGCVLSTHSSIVNIQSEWGHGSSSSQCFLLIVTLQTRINSLPTAFTIQSKKIVGSRKIETLWVSYLRKELKENNTMWKQQTL